jgi:hypothetical protein
MQRIDPPAATRRPQRRTRGSVAAALLLALAACDGDTLYEGGGGGGGGPTEPPPPTTGASGTIVPFPTGTGAIGDLVVDADGRRVFLSNRSAHRVEVLQMPSGAAPAFGTPVSVGSEPWGMSLSRTGDTLIVANSGGVNVSFVPLAASPLQEDVGRRFQIPRARLYQFLIEKEVTQAGDTLTSFRLEHTSYADRPQYVAQDARGRLLYSVVPTQAAPVGTIRLAEWRQGWPSWDARFLFAEGLLAGGPPSTNRAITASNPEDFAIANVDSISLEFINVGPFAGPTGAIRLFDHDPRRRPGEPGYLIANPGYLDPVDAIVDLHDRGSDVIAYPGHSWNIPDAAQMADTTFVAVSADHRWVAFGEAPEDRAGRIVLWGAGAEGGSGDLSRIDDVADITNNTSDRLTGIGLNADGTLGVARGREATYFFGNDLRLQGLARAGSSGGVGAALRPGSSGAATLAFIGTGSRTIQVLETTHYQVVGEVTVGAAVVGPLRAGPPLPEQTACPADYTQGSPTCVLARVYGVTASGLLVLDVLRRDVR